MTARVLFFVGAVLEVLASFHTAVPLVVLEPLGIACIGLGLAI